MMTMEQVFVDVGPAFTKNVGERIAADGVCIFSAKAEGV